MKAPSEQAVTKRFRLSRRLAVEITVGSGGFSCEWDPEVPPLLTAKEERAYLRARNEMMIQLALMVDAPGVIVSVRGRAH